MSVRIVVDSTADLRAEVAEQGTVSDVFINPQSQAAKQLVFSLSEEVQSNV